MTPARTFVEKGVQVQVQISVGATRHFGDGRDYDHEGACADMDALGGKSRPQEGFQEGCHQACRLGVTGGERAARLQ